MRKTLLAATLMIAPALFAADAPDYIFYFIGDGMGLNPVMTTQAYNRDVLKNDSTLLMLRFPTASWAMTYSASAPITDSAAAGTALSTGFKTKNGMLGMNPDTVSVTSIAKELQQQGYGIGLVTSVGADDATPGAFYAHVPYRKLYHDIDVQAAESGYEFIGGAGFAGMKDADGNPSDIVYLFEQNDIQLIEGLPKEGEITSRRVALTATPHRPWNIGYTIDSVAGQPTLPQMTHAALDHLEKQTPDKFFLMVEGGNIDHALHANDGGAAIKEILKFDEAIRIAYNFYLQHPDKTLIVITADHDTGGMSHVHSKTSFPNPLSAFDYQKISKEEFSTYCKSLLKTRMNYTWDDMKDYLSENLGLFSHIPVSAETEEELKEKFDETFEMRNSADQKTLYASFNAFAVEVFKVLNRAAGTIFTSVGHSGNPVPVFAIGVGAEDFRHVNNNIEIPAIIRHIADLK